MLRKTHTMSSGFVYLQRQDRLVIDERVHRYRRAGRSAHDGGTLAVPFGGEDKAQGKQRTRREGGEALPDRPLPRFVPSMQSLANLNRLAAHIPADV